MHAVLIIDVFANKRNAGKFDGRAHANYLWQIHMRAASMIRISH